MALYNIFKTTNVTMLTKVILESPCKVLQMPSKINTLKRLLHASRFTNRSNFFFLVFIFSFFFFFLFFFFAKSNLGSQNKVKIIFLRPASKKQWFFRNFWKNFFLLAFFRKLQNFSAQNFTFSKNMEKDIPHLRRISNLLSFLTLQFFVKVQTLLSTLVANLNVKIEERQENSLLLS